MTAYDQWLTGGYDEYMDRGGIADLDALAAEALLDDAPAEPAEEAHDALCFCNTCLPPGLPERCPDNDVPF